MVQVKKVEELLMEEIFVLICCIIFDEDGQFVDDGNVGDNNEVLVVEEVVDDMSDVFEMLQDDFDKLFDMDGDDDDVVSEDEGVDDMVVVMMVDVEDDGDDQDDDDVFELIEELVVEGDMDMVEGLVELFDNFEGDIFFVVDLELEFELDLELVMDEVFELELVFVLVIEIMLILDELLFVKVEDLLILVVIGYVVYVVFDNFFDMLISIQVQIIEELVCEMLWFMLKVWFDQNLLLMVEEMVKKEIQWVIWCC